MLKYVEDFRIIKEYKRLKVEVTEMENRRKNRRKQYLRRNFFLAAGIFLLLLLTIAVLVFRMRAQGEKEADTEEGIAYLESLEAKDMNSIQQEIKTLRKEEQREALTNGDLTVWEQFTDYAILGDSRTMGFDQYGFLPSERILAHGGATIADIPEYMEQLKALNPSYVFQCYGLNDVSIGYWETPQAYTTDLGKAVESIRTELPDAQVFVNSIFPAQDPAFEQSEEWRKIPEYNEVIKAYCEENGYPYIDNTQIVEEHSDLYDEDGIHLQEDFYEYWAVNMLAEVMADGESS